MKEWIKGKRVTVIGAARSGIAVANAVTLLGGRARISDAKPQAQAERELDGLESRESVSIECGGHTPAFIQESDLVVISPGVRLDAAPLLWARQAGVPVMGEIEFAWRLCPCPIVAVTGSNGKTTTVTLIAEVLKAAGRNVVLCGNIGSPFARHVLGLTPTDIVVLEVSSFQLEATTTFRPHVAVWLNFSQNHLDRHRDMQEYFEAKRRILANLGPQEVAVLNHSQEALRALASSLPCRVVFFDGPGAPSDIDHPNHLAALAATAAMGVGEDVARRVFTSFRGVEHRQELVATIDGVDYINDSKSTTPEAGQWALTRARKPTVLICGGSDKHLGFDHLRPLVRSRVKLLLAMGQTKDQLAATFADVVPVVKCANLSEALSKAREAAVVGDCIMLSPMCASFDMFKDYEDRGRQFKELVRGLAAHA